MSFSVDESLLVKCLRQGNSACGEILIRKYDCEPLAITPDTNYTSEIFSVRVEYECDGRAQTEFMVCKVPYVHKLYKIMTKAGFYENETYMYTSIVPKLLEIWPLAAVPKHYLVTESQVLVLEDLTKQGYLLFDQSFWNLEESILLLEEVAKLHAASVKLQQTCPSVLEPTSRVTLFRVDLVAAVKNNVYPSLLEILRVKQVDSRVLQRFAEYKQKIDHISIYEIPDRVSDLKVLVHGNLKANNVLLKKDAGGRPVSAKILDYQTYYWQAPVFELLYFFVLTVDCDVYEKHQDLLVDTYLATLNRALSNFGCECAYSRQQFDVDLEGTKLYQVFTLLFCSIIDLRESIAGFDGFFQGDPSYVPNGEEVQNVLRNRGFEGRFLKWFRYFERHGYFD